MSRIELEQNITSELKFQIDISGTTLSVSDVRLSIINESIILSYRGILKDNIATFNVRNAELILPVDKELLVQLEVFLGDRHFFVPFSGIIIITKPIDIKAEMIENEPKIVVAMENATHKIGETAEIGVRLVKSYLEADKKSEEKKSTEENKKITKELKIETGMEVDKHIEVLNSLKKSVDDFSKKIIFPEQTEELVKNIVGEIIEDKKEKTRDPKWKLSKHIKDMIAKNKVVEKD